MKRKLSSKLSVSFILIVLVTVFLIGISANLLIRAQFEMFAADQQDFCWEYIAGNDFRFLDTLNRILLVVSIISIIGAGFGGRILAKRLLLPISKAIDFTKDISEGNYEIRFEANVGTQELSELKDAVNQMADSLQRQEQLRSRLISDVAHELRTPIANVTAQLETILEGVWEATPQRLQSCKEELWRICSLISDLEQHQQIEYGNLKLQPETVDILALTHHTVASFEPELRRMLLNCTVSGEAFVICCDRNRLQQVFANLLSNAMKYSPQQTNIAIHISCLGQQLIWSITDQGIGIPEADLPYVFERFYRTDRSRNRKTSGAGIGLAIVKAIVQAHGGSITVEPNGLSGTRFTIYLPLL